MQQTDLVLIISDPFPESTHLWSLGVDVISALAGQRCRVALVLSAQSLTFSLKELSLPCFSKETSVVSRYVNALF